jgi:hypothetical protein
MPISAVHDDVVSTFMETRLFPKNQGADAYQTTGIAARCDLVIHSDRNAPQAFVERRSPGRVRTVFVSLRYPKAALQTLVEDVLPGLEGPLIIVSGSEDCTFPVQSDKRFPDYDAEVISQVYRVLDSAQIDRWYAENLCGARHPKFSPIPLGLVFKTDDERRDFTAAPSPPLSQRPDKALCAHRVREGDQWSLRRTITGLARKHWRSFTTIPEGELAPEAFELALHSHAFVICAEGGGIDPSPKAWQAISCGSIPIIRRTDLEAAYARLPVLFVEDWTADALSLDFLRTTKQSFIDRYGDELVSPSVAERLELDYWWTLIAAAAPV